MADREPPLFPDANYDFWLGHYNLLDPAPCGIDAKMRDVCRHFAASPAYRRAEIRASIDVNGFDELTGFAWRSAVFALRERDPELVRDGLTAMALIAWSRTDLRDAGLPLSLLEDAAVSVAVDAAQLLLEAAAIAEPWMKTLMEDLARRSPESREERAREYVQVDTPHGAGFIHWGHRKYEPDADLQSLVVEVADLVSSDDYELSSVEGATELPDVWLIGPDDAELHRVLEAVRGGASVTGDLRPREHIKRDTHRIMIFLVETETVPDAKVLMRLASSSHRGGFRRLGCRAGRLFGLVVAQAIWDGVAPCETEESLARFESPITAALRRYAT